MTKMNQKVEQIQKLVQQFPTAVVRRILMNMYKQDDLLQVMQTLYKKEYSSNQQQVRKKKSRQKRLLAEYFAYDAPIRFSTILRKLHGRLIGSPQQRKENFKEILIERINYMLSFYDTYIRKNESYFCFTYKKQVYCSDGNMKHTFLKEDLGNFIDMNEVDESFLRSYYRQLRQTLKTELKRQPANVYTVLVVCSYPRTSNSFFDAYHEFRKHLTDTLGKHSISLRFMFVCQNINKQQVNIDLPLHKNDSIIMVQDEDFNEKTKYKADIIWFAGCNIFYWIQNGISNISSILNTDGLICFTESQSYVNKHGSTLPKPFIEPQKLLRYKQPLLKEQSDQNTNTDMILRQFLQKFKQLGNTGFYVKK